MKKSTQSITTAQRAELAKMPKITESTVSQWATLIPQGRAWPDRGGDRRQVKADPPPRLASGAHLSVARATRWEEIPSVQRATVAAKADPTNAQPGRRNHHATSSYQPAARPTPAPPSARSPWCCRQTSHHRCPSPGLPRGSGFLPIPPVAGSKAGKLEIAGERTPE